MGDVQVAKTELNVSFLYQPSGKVHMKICQQSFLQLKSHDLLLGK